jgi:hypothetical protein
LCLVTFGTVEQICGLHGRKENFENAELNSLYSYNVPYFLEYPTHIFQKKFMPKSGVHDLFASKLTATHSYLALQRIANGSNPVPSWHSYISHTTSEGAVHLD